ncbi:hypothetical protein [Vibrio harveyi]|uniref:hypothetical protein n=1 Tax=Vibrio harveyi TaxID=669 RepID=UPI003CEBB12B
MQQQDLQQQKDQWLEEIDMTLTEQQCRELGWEQTTLFVEMFSFLCMAVISCALVMYRGGTHDY